MERSIASSKSARQRSAIWLNELLPHHFLNDWGALWERVGNSQDIVRIIHETVREDQQLFLLLLRSGDPMRMFEKFVTFGENALIDQIVERSGLPRADADLLAYYIISASTAVIIRFAKETTFDTHREQLFQDFIVHGLDGFK